MFSRDIMHRVKEAAYYICELETMKERAMEVADYTRVISYIYPDTEPLMAETDALMDKVIETLERLQEQTAREIQGAHDTDTCE